MDLIIIVFSLALACELDGDFKCADENYQKAIALCEPGSPREKEIVLMHEGLKMVWAERRAKRVPTNLVGECPPESGDYECPMQVQETERMSALWPLSGADK